MKWNHIFVSQLAQNLISWSLCRPPCASCSLLGLHDYNLASKCPNESTRVFKGVIFQALWVSMSLEGFSWVFMSLDKSPLVSMCIHITKSLYESPRVSMSLKVTLWASNCHYESPWVFKSPHEFLWVSKGFYESTRVSWVSNIHHSLWSFSVFQEKSVIFGSSKTTMSLLRPQWVFWDTHGSSETPMCLLRHSWVSQNHPFALRFTGREWMSLR